MFQENGTSNSKRRRTDSSSAMAEGADENPVPGLRVEESPEHGMKVLRGLNHLKMEKVLCDVALIAEGNHVASKLRTLLYINYMYI